MASFSEEYRAFKHWQTEDRTPEDYELHLKLVALWNEVERLLAENVREDEELIGLWFQLQDFIEQNELY